MHNTIARVVKLVYTRRSGRRPRKGVEVQVLSRAQNKQIRFLERVGDTGLEPVTFSV